MMYNIHCGAIRWQIPDFLSGGISNVNIFQRLPVKIATWKVWPLKIVVDVTEYSIRNGPIRWQTWTTIKSIREHIPLALTVFEIFTFQNSWSWKCRSRSWCTTFVMAPFVGKYVTSYDGNSIVCSLTRYSQWRSRSRRRKTVVSLFDWKCSIPYRWFISEF